MTRPLRTDRILRLAALVRDLGVTVRLEPSGAVVIEPNAAPKGDDDPFALVEMKR